MIMLERNNKGTDMDRIKYFIGWVLAKLFPKKVEEVRDNFTFPNYWWGKRSGRYFVNRSIRFYLGCKMKEQEHKIPGTLETIHRNFWSKEDTFYSVTKGRTEKEHIPTYKDIVQQLKPLLEEKDIQTVCEFGAGDGSWLNYLSQEWTVVKQFIGIDISERQVDENNKTYKHLKFIQSDLVEWTETNAIPNTLYHTCSGVLEFLSEESVKRLFNILRNRTKDSIIFLIEPLYGRYDLSQDFASRIIGKEHTYSHNYVYLLETAGIKIIRYEEREVMGYRMLIVLAFNEM